MNKQAKIELLKGYYLTHFNVNLSLSEVEELQKIARVLQRNAEKLCNGEIQQDRWDQVVSRSLDRLGKIFASTKISARQIEIQGDPRGFCLKIHRTTDLELQSFIAPDYFN